MEQVLVLGESMSLDKSVAQESKIHATSYSGVCAEFVPGVGKRWAMNSLKRI